MAVEEARSRGCDPHVGRAFSLTILMKPAGSTRKPYPTQAAALSKPVHALSVDLTGRTSSFAFNVLIPFQYGILAVAFDEPDGFCFRPFPWTFETSVLSVRDMEKVVVHLRNDEPDRGQVYDIWIKAELKFPCLVKHL